MIYSEINFIMSAIYSSNICQVVPPKPETLKDKYQINYVMSKVMFNVLYSNVYAYVLMLYM